MKERKEQYIANRFDRRQDARRKIMMGGLIIKAGLDHFYPENVDLLYGMLLDCRDTLIATPELANKWKALGSALKQTTV